MCLRPLAALPIGGRPCTLLTFCLLFCCLCVCVCGVVLSQEELRTAIRLVNPNQAESTMIDKMLALADSDGDKEVSFDEFKQIMRTVFGRAKSAPTEEEQVAA